jgi:hypothetical protein
VTPWCGSPGPPPRNMMSPAWPKRIICGHGGVTSRNAQKTGLSEGNIRYLFWPGTPPLPAGQTPTVLPGMGQASPSSLAQISRSNAADRDSNPAIARTAGVVRSSASASDTNPTPRCSVPEGLPADPLPTGPSGPAAIPARHRSRGSGRPRAVSHAPVVWTAPEPISRTFLLQTHRKRADTDMGNQYG